MTRTARYNAETNTFRELPGMEKPKRPFAANYDSQENFDLDLQHYEFLITRYNDHLASLREIPGHESCRSVFKDQGVYEEGKDYEVRYETVYTKGADKWLTPEPSTGNPFKEENEMAFPLIRAQSDDSQWRELFDNALGTRPQSEDELWRELINEISNDHMQHDYSGSYIKTEEAIQQLKKHYTITPR